MKVKIMNIKEYIFKGNEIMTDTNKNHGRNDQQQKRSSRKMNFMSGGQS